VPDTSASLTLMGAGAGAGAGAIAAAVSVAGVSDLVQATSSATTGISFASRRMVFPSVVSGLLNYDQHRWFGFVSKVPRPPACCQNLEIELGRDYQELTAVSLG